MEIIIVLAALLALVGIIAGVVATRRRGDTGLDLEPPAPTRPVGTGDPGNRPPVARTDPRTMVGPPQTGHGDAALPDPGMVAEIEEALANAEADEQVAAGTEDGGAAEGAPEAPEPATRPSFRDRLSKARNLFSGYVGSVLSRPGIDDETWDELEEALIRADVGVQVSTALIEKLRTQAAESDITEPEALVEQLKADLKEQLAVEDRSLHFDAGTTNVWLFVGVNGVGKTTTIGKLGKQQAAEGRQVVMAAGDTFRAAAAEQLGMWAERTGADLVRGAEGGDPSSVIFDAVQRAASRGAELVLADTAGRLHTKVNLMEELKKVRRVAGKEPGNVTEVLLVIDATTGQNGLVQAQQFLDAVEVTGVVLTKLDGSAKGGIVLAIQSELGIPVKLVGLGETVDDLVAFDPDEFVDALFAA
jgi:fused signal recognition particle receptor